MNKLTGLILITIFSFCISGPGMTQEVTVVVKGLAWDSDSWGSHSIKTSANSRQYRKRHAEGLESRLMDGLMYSPSRAWEVNLSLQLQRHNRLLS